MRSIFKLPKLIDTSTWQTINQYKYASYLSYGIIEKRDYNWNLSVQYFLLILIFIIVIADHLNVCKVFEISESRFLDT